MTIKSPCVKICKIETVDGSEICMGCNRTLVQIRDWANYTDQEREEIMDELPPTAYNSTIGSSGDWGDETLITFYGFSSVIPLCDPNDERIDAEFEKIRGFIRFATKLKYM